MKTVLNVIVMINNGPYCHGDDSNLKFPFNKIVAVLNISKPDGDDSGVLKKHFLQL